MVVVYILNFIDRQILYMLLEDIKEELVLSDTQLGFLSGIAFAIFYSTLGLPIARYADRNSRSSVIAVALFVWSGMTALTSFSQSFWQLALARVGVGVGEAGCSPPAHSLISDLFPPQRRATALAIYAIGIPVGSGLGFFLGGWLGEFYGWRQAFLIVGLPGVLMAFLVHRFLHDPPRGATAPAKVEPTSDPGNGETIRDVAKFMWPIRSFRHIALAAALHGFYGYGSSAFLPSFFRRVHGMSQSEFGTYMAAILLTAGVLGTYLGGALTDKIGRRDRRWFLWLPALATLAGLPFSFLLYLYPDRQIAFLGLIPQTLLGLLYLGPTFAMTQSLVRPSMRALASAVLLLVINLIGLGLGPQFVGILSDLLAPRFGVESIRYALLFTVVGGAVWSSLHYCLGARYLRADLDAVS